MPPPIPVVLTPYDRNWPLLAADRIKALEVLGGLLVDVHHIGSTSVPGLAAKPILDLLAIVTDLPGLDGARVRVERLGYVWWGEYGIEGRRYCTLDAGGARLVQLHCFAESSPEIARHLAFRDYLRDFPEVAAAYELEKRRARDLHPSDSHAYGQEKAAWIAKFERVALIWREKSIL